MSNYAERIKQETERLKPLWPKGIRVFWDHFGHKRYGSTMDVDGCFIRVKPDDNPNDPIWLDYRKLEKVSA
ncbi:hypothetical protein HWB51_gp045 [Mycobacterium phage Cuke]|uniref:Uncharacterized protein n=1 Tax=Mycobacterium phage Cuke TaxID=2079417 RepID=A0A2L1IX24_9CAUD|nr:hypothetical protein HWB51_gp045 [Mycobacterium phage Cuke]AVD99663.1 hypothetical protein SEA_CUKE_45 [Mycobacterium phage Cuke]